MGQTIFEQMDGTYTRIGDYLVPNLQLPENEANSIGIWGQGI